MTRPGLSDAVLAAKQRLAEGRAKLREQHDSGSPGVQVCARLTDLLDTVLLDLFQAALDEIGEPAASELQSGIALVAHGGYGRRDVAPYSDVDLMLLHAPGLAERVKPLARRLSQNMYDAGLQLGFSTRSPADAWRWALKDATVFTSLVESRFLGGSVGLFRRYFERFRRIAQRRWRSLVAAVEQARRDERRKFGETIFLLRPNIKRSRGGLRDIQLLRWVGFARYGETDPDALYRLGALSKDDQRKLRAAREFLLRLRNELHFRAGKAEDVLEKSEQVRLAEASGLTMVEGVLPVEQFMRSYFEHTSEVHYTVSHFLDSVRTRVIVGKVLGPLFSHQVERDFRVGPVHIGATRRGLEKVTGDLAQVLRLMDLANLYDKPIEHFTWQAIRESMMNHPVLELSPEACSRFLSLLSQPAQLGALLRRLHQLRVLEKIVPAVAHARCLLQFNEYHKYTVDEHSLRAIEQATDMLNDSGPLGEAYRGIKEKRTLHLALLLHDLGKGFPDDHSERGMRIAAETAVRLNLPPAETERLKFLVHKHLIMAHLAFWRDISDERTVVQFAVEVGSPDALKMLFVLTCADVAAVGPGVLNQWKLQMLTDLYRRAMRHLAGEGPIRSSSDRLAKLRREVRSFAGDGRDEWWDKQLAVLPAGYLTSRPAKQTADELRTLRRLPANDAVAWGHYLPVRTAVEYTIGTHESITPGVFHKLTGAFTSKGLQILWAEIDTLADGVVLDRFHVVDSDYSGEPPAERIDEICRAVVSALKDSSGKPPTFRRTWQNREGASLHSLPTRVHVDNSTAEKYSIIDVFTHDRRGLLYTISRTLFELGLSVSIAKIGTHLDQVVDVFYVTDQQGQKIQNESRVAEIRTRLLEAIEQMEPAPA